MTIFQRNAKKKCVRKIFILHFASICFIDAYCCIKFDENVYLQICMDLVKICLKP